MRALIAFVVVVCAFSVAGRAFAAEFDVARLQTHDGALLMAPNSHDVEPYFATKSLIIAHDAGLDVTDAARAWIRWLLPRQREDGNFERYCEKNKAWRACGRADADDSMNALWLQLLYQTAPASGLPAEWQASADRARSALFKLRNSRLGVFHVSSRNHEALLMDNVEVYWALADVARAQKRFGQAQPAAATSADAARLANAIQRVFWDGHRFRASMQKTRAQFYPDVVAQTYPWLAGMPTAQGDARQAWPQWKQSYAPAWPGQHYDPQ